ncbi:hypothetical protein FI667_g6914, partial [Globisporangium splendens]
MATEFTDLSSIALKFSAGATSLAEVDEKICARSTTAISLEKEKAQAEVKLIAAWQEKEQAVQTLNELKASGIGGIELNREVYNALESEIQQAKATLKVNKSAYERLGGVISGVRQGSFGLAQWLKAFDDVLDMSGLETSSSLLNAAGLNTTTQRGENVDCLAIAELKLTKMLELIGQQNSSVSSFGGFGGNGSGAEENFEDGTSRADMDDCNALWSPHVNNDPVFHRNNTRVRPGMTLRMRQQNERDDSMDSARPDTSGTSDSGSDHIDVLVPSRDILKMSSSRRFPEVMRKKEVPPCLDGLFLTPLGGRWLLRTHLVEKQKVAAEKGISDEETMSKLGKRNQLEADTRLSTSPTWQKGFTTSPTGRDDLKSKSIAFVTQLNFSDL